MVTPEQKIMAMLWEFPPEKRKEIAGEILSDPIGTFQKDNVLFVKALNTLQWYDLIRLTGAQKLGALLTDQTIQQLFPHKRRKYYTNARRLLLKYVVPTSG